MIVFYRALKVDLDRSYRQHHQWINPGKSMAETLHLKTYLLFQHIRQPGKFAALNQKRRYFGDFSKGIMLTQRALQISCAAGATRARAQTNHPPDHRKV